MWWSLMLGVLAGAGPDPTELAPPVRLQAAGQPINVDIGHAAPFVADLRGDGKMTLLVGQFGEGKLRLYPITGSKDAPRLGKFEWLQAGGKTATVPAG